MSELESRRLSVPALVPTRSSLGPDADDLDTALPPEETRTREGLPPGFRMRHDAHYVDQLAARSPVPQVRAIPVRDIDARVAAHAHDLDPLARSIGRHGVLQPLHVRARHGRYELIAGARRLGAAALAGLAEVPCVVHACDDTRARALADADNLRASAPPPGVTTTGTVRHGLEELRRSFGTIESCLHLVDTRAASLRDRVALDIVRTEASRAGRLVRCLAALDADPAIVARLQPIRPIIEQVLEATETERRLAGVSVTFDAGKAAIVGAVDDEWFGVAIWAALGTMLALVQGSRDAAVQLGVSISATQASIVIELLAQRSAGVQAPMVSRFFDPEWTERPGGYQAAVEAAGARRLLTLHGGRAELVPLERGGCRLLAVVPAGG